ncbi:MAG: hypothetical protein AB1556_07500 [Bacillota bacterium]
MEVKCATCHYAEWEGCSWLCKGIPPAGAVVKKLPWAGDGQLHDYVVECPEYR